MKSYTMYVCETCGFECKNGKEMMKHEADHLGLTVSEFEKYNAMKSFAKYVSSLVYNTNNEDYKKKYDKAIEDLITFERKHGISTR